MSIKTYKIKYSGVAKSSGDTARPVAKSSGESAHERAIRLIKIKTSGIFTASNLKKEGFSTEDLIKAGDSGRAVPKSSGESADERKKRLRKIINNENYNDLLNKGYSGKELKEGDISLDDLKNIDYDPGILYDDGKGYILKDLFLYNFNFAKSKKEDFNNFDIFYEKHFYDYGDIKYPVDRIKKLINLGFKLWQIKKYFQITNILSAKKETKYQLKDFIKEGKYEQDEVISLLLNKIKIHKDEKFSKYFPLDEIINYFEPSVLVNELKFNYINKFFNSDSFNSDNVHKLLIKLKNENKFTAKHFKNITFFKDPHLLKLKKVFSAKELKEGGYGAEYLKINLKYSVKELKDAGFTVRDLKKEGFKLKDYYDVFDLKELNEGGYSLRDFKNENYDLSELQEAFSASVKDFKDAGFYLWDIIDAFRTKTKKLKEAGYTAEKLYSNGAKLFQLKNAGFSVKDLQELDIGPRIKKLIIEAGYTAKELKEGGFKAIELKREFRTSELKDGGYTAKELKDADFTASDLKAAGFTVRDLKEGGFNAGKLKEAGYTVEYLKEAGFNICELINAGFSAYELKANFTASDLKEAGFSTQKLKDAGFTEELNKAGFTNLDKDICIEKKPWNALRSRRFFKSDYNIYYYPKSSQDGLKLDLGKVIDLNNIYEDGYGSNADGFPSVIKIYNKNECMLYNGHIYNTIGPEIKGKGKEGEILKYLSENGLLEDKN